MGVSPELLYHVYHEQGLSEWIHCQENVLYSGLQIDVSRCFPVRMHEKSPDWICQE